MVVIFLPDTLAIGVMHERAGSPSMCTVHAPHSAIPQPNFVPVISSVSRSTHKSGICGSTSTVVDFPFRIKVVLTSPLQPPISYNTSAMDGNQRKVGALGEKTFHGANMPELWS